MYEALNAAAELFRELICPIPIDIELNGKLIPLNVKHLGSLLSGWHRE